MASDRNRRTIHKDNSISVHDNVGGCLQDYIRLGNRHLKLYLLSFMPAEFGQGGIKTSGGLHGVGASVVNALSEWLEVTIIEKVIFINKNSKTVAYLLQH